MFYGCNNLIIAPELPATTLVTGCYTYMFYNCKKINYIKALFNTAPSSTYMNNWVNGVATTGTFVKSKTATWTDTFGVSSIPSGWNVVKDGFIDNYLTITALEDAVKVSFSNQVQISPDAITWSSYAPDSTITLNAGQKAYYKSTLTPTTTGIGNFKINGMCNLSGNCNSLLFGDNASSNNDLTGYDYAFYELFKGCTGIIEVSDNFLPATILSTACYDAMFIDCTNLTKTPKLYATIMKPYCYANMFVRCKSLVNPSVFDISQSITPAAWCCGYMFSECSGIISAKTPRFISNPTISERANCVNSMFNKCTSLNRLYIYMLDVSVYLPSCSRYWLSNVSSNGVIVSFFDLSDIERSDNGIPNGWKQTFMVTV